MKFYHFAVLRESTIVLSSCLMLLRPVFWIAQKHHPFKHAVYCCSSINNAFGQHFRTYSAKTALQHDIIIAHRGFTICPPLTPIRTRGVRNWFISYRPTAKTHWGCASTNHARTAYDHMSAHGGCAYDSCRFQMWVWKFRSDQGIPWSERNFQAHIWKRNADSKFKFKT